MTVYYCDAYFRVFYYTSLVWKNWQTYLKS